MAAQSYGPLEGLRPMDVPLPVPGPGEARVRVAASALNPADYKVLLGQMKLLHGRVWPLVLGYDFSGTVDAVGPRVTEISVGDQVFGFLPYGPGNRRGAFAEALIARVDQLAPKPAGVPHEIAAASATTGVTALQAIRDLGRLPAAGGRLLVTGVSGGVGSISVAIGLKLGASVTAVGTGQGLELARRLGAIEALDRSAGNLPSRIQGSFDVVFDAAAAYRWGAWGSVLEPGGAFVTTLPSLTFVADKLRSLLSSTRVHLVTVKPRRADLERVAQWLKEGLDVPLAATIPVREVAAGLAQLQRSGGRIAVQVQGGF